MILVSLMTNPPSRAAIEKYFPSRTTEPYRPTNPLSTAPVQ